MWDDVLRLHRARGRTTAPGRAALLVAEPKTPSAEQPWWLALDSVVVLGSGRGDSPAMPRMRMAKRRGGSAVTVLGALIELLVEAPDTHVVVVTSRGAARTASLDQAVQRAFVAAESDPEAVIVVAGRDDALAGAWLIPSGTGVVRPAAVVPPPASPQSQRRLDARGALRDAGIAVAHGRALFEVFARVHPLLVRMFTYAAELPADQRDDYLDAACSDLATPNWDAALLAACPRLWVVPMNEGAGSTTRSMSGTLAACEADPEDDQRDASQG